MATFEVEAPRELHPIGLHTFTLADVETITMKSYDGAGEVDRLLWRFVSNKKGKEGTYLEVPVFTGQKYGNSKAKLTWLLDMLVPGMSPAQAKSLNTDTFVGRKYEGMVKHQPAERDPDTKISTFAYVRPIDVSDVLADPFVSGNEGADPQCEVCGQTLTPAELKGSETRWPDQHRFCSHHGREKIALEKIEAAEAEDAFSAAAG